VHIHTKLPKLILVVFFMMLSQPALAKLSVLACEPEWAALVTEIGGQHVKVYSATTAMQDPHQIQARPSLIAKARRADMIACSGAGLEAGWLPVLLRKSANPKIQAGKPGHFLATDHVELLGKVADDPTNIHAAGNPHVHLDPVRVALVAEALANVLSSIDAENADAYQSNLRDFNTTWDSAMYKWNDSANKLQRRSVIVHHDSWVYLLQWLGIKQVAALEPKHGVPPSTSYLAKLLETVKQQQVDMIVRSGYEDERPSDWLSHKSGIPVITIPFSVSDYGTPGELKKWMDNVISRLLKGNGN